MSVFQLKADNTKQCFFGDPVNVARYDQCKYPFFEGLTEKQLSFFWRPEEISLTRDQKDFKLLTETEKHIFTSNLKRQILLDSVQGRAPATILAPICSLPELESFIIFWTAFEQIHSRSYQYILKNVFPNPSKVFDEMMDIKEIVDCANDISAHYDELYHLNCLREVDKIGDVFYTDKMKYKHKKNLWLCLNAVNALEGIRFYVSFACAWAFAEMKKMEGNAKIIKFIARDENLHLAATQQIIKILPKEDPDFTQIAEETKPQVINIFVNVINQEKDWARFLFKDGSIIGLNEQLLCNYVEWIANRRLKTIGLDTLFDMPNNPLPWTQKWIAGQDVQIFPQETEISSYTVSEIVQDVDDSVLKGLSI